MKINKPLKSKKIKESVEPEVLWRNRNRSIIKDGYGFGISNGVNVNRFYINNDGKAVYDYEPPMTIKTTVDRLVRQDKFNNPHYSENPKYVGNISKYGKGVEEAFEKDGGPFWYFTRHGLGPGMLPKGVNVVDTIEEDNFGTYIALDKVLSTQELKDYELKEKKPNVKEGLSHFEFTSGSNPYIAKTKSEVDRIKRSRGDSVRYVGSINGIDYYKVDDGEEKDLFSVDESFTNELSTENAINSIVDQIKKFYELGGLEKLPVGRENALTADLCGPDKDRLVGYFRKQPEFNYELNDEAGIISHEFISDKYDIEIFDTFIQMYKISQNESLSESIKVNTIADYITDHYDFDDIDDKYACINSIKDSHKDTISQEELEQFIGAHNGKDKVEEGYEFNPNKADISWRPYDNEKGEVMADKWYASKYPDDEIGIEQLEGITLDDALKDRSILGHCDTQVRERVYAQLDKYIPISKDSPMFKKVNESSLDEASYGGAFDIADDQYFTREDLDSFAEEVLNHINETFNAQFDIASCYIDNGVLEVGVTNDKYGDYSYSEKIDMRKIKEPWHLKRAYAFEFASQLINDITQSNDGLVEAYDDDVDDLTYYYEDEVFKHNLETNPYTEIETKQVPDSDGFMTDYTMYMDMNTGEYVFIFGDKDVYCPDNGYFYFDWECETEEEAREWFNNYNGFEESEFDDFEESYETEKVFSAACNNRMDYMKKGFAKGKINPNDRFNRFNSDHSYIMGALRNGNKDMVKYLQDQGGTILDDEQDEYNRLMGEEMEQSPIVHKKNDGTYLVAASSGDGYTAYNKNDVCVGHITANNENEAKTKFNSNQFDEEFKNK